MINYLARVYYTVTEGNSFYIPFRFIARQHVFVYVDDVLIDASSYTWDSTNDRISFATKPDAGAEVLIRRMTPTNGLVSYVRSTVNSDRNLSLDSLQQFFLIQENIDEINELVAAVGEMDFPFLEETVEDLQRQIDEIILNMGVYPIASETERGIAQFATISEQMIGASGLKISTPAGVKAYVNSVLGTIDPTYMGITYEADGVQRLFDFPGVFLTEKYGITVAISGVLQQNYEIVNPGISSQVLFPEPPPLGTEVFIATAERVQFPIASEIAPGIVRFGNDAEVNDPTNNAVAVTPMRMWQLAVPKGTIVFWRGIAADVPVGWKILTELANTFLIGAATDTDVGTTGGAVEHRHNVEGDVEISPTVLTLAQIPSHSHTIAYGRGTTVGERARLDLGGTTNTQVSTGSAGSSQPHEHTGTLGNASAMDANHLPPFMRFYIIEKL